MNSKTSLTFKLNPMHGYQKKALKFSLSKPNCYLAMDMGLGKTRIALERCKNKLDNGILVIAPLKAIYTTWPDEIEKWQFGYKYNILHGPDKLERFGNPADIYLVNFEGIAWLFEALKTYWKIKKKMPFRSVIIDEGSAIKSHSTKRFKILRKLRDIFHNRMILSGTPAPNSYLDLWAQYFFLDGGLRLGKSFVKYQHTYFVPDDYKGFRWSFRSDKEKAQVYKRIADITFRLDGKDYLKMPERIDNVIPLALPPQLYGLYKELEKNFFLELKEGEVEAFNAASLSMKLRQFIQGGLYTDKKGNWIHVHNQKLEKLKEIVESADGQGVLVPIQFKFELELLRKTWPKAPAIVGGVPMPTVAKIVRDWNAGKIKGPLFCHPASLSHAVNMQSGSPIIVWYGLTWSSEQYQQLNARIHRQGQKKTVIVHHFVMNGTVDQAVMQALKKKIFNQNELLTYIKDYHEKGITELPGVQYRENTEIKTTQLDAIKDAVSTFTGGR